jgi:hypothetical protein
VTVICRELRSVWTATAVVPSRCPSAPKVLSSAPVP